MTDNTYWCDVDTEKLLGAYNFGASVIREQIKDGTEVAPSVLERFLEVTDELSKRVVTQD